MNNYFILPDNNNSFYTAVSYSGMTDDAYNDISDSLNFTNQTPLIQFEQSIGLDNAYRSFMNGQMEEWMNNADLNLSSYPKSKTLFSGSELSLINIKQQVMIGDTVYQFLKDGYFMVGEDYSTALNSINNAITNNNDYQLLVWYFVFPPADCKTWKASGDEKKFGANDKYKVIYSTGIRSVGLVCKTFARIESFEKKNNRWKNYKRSMTSHLNAILVNEECEYLTQSIAKKTKTKAEVETSWVTLQSQSFWSYRAKKGEVTGSFTVGDNNYYVALNW